MASDITGFLINSKQLGDVHTESDTERNIDIDDIFYTEDSENPSTSGDEARPR